ncbi:hypothetical protein [Listeria monocytogenes]|uniref:hypothetical protein n=1 Tax=Listeria monocytogenes TaxID=1639 RepID=UPI0027E64566|nr:hypothetical protein [Listeria monocytogenes]EHD1704524.1 hypothetical protein [Listeria monocytogenes]EHD5882101.1 hypothetical protein [Listeria monocytogenes]EIL5928357.1 hypothetical protein [Listeria monocytogenes]EJN2655031.1 hypothetical protein [Listeria monocytogenes]
MIKGDNQPAFCIEYRTLLTGGFGFTPSELTIAEKTPFNNCILWLPNKSYY